MKFRYSWVRDFVETDLDPAAAGARLTALGFVLDGLEPWGDDGVLDLDVGTNRPDAMCHRGIARELAAALDAPLLGHGTPVAEDPSAGEADGAVSVRIEAEDLCRRYAARVIEDAAPRPSPDSRADRLRSIGLRPVDSIVDATNYALHERGHPLHAFDLDRVRSGRIVVRRARPGETLVTLDGVERRLDPDVLVIADAEGPIALAGVMGGRDTEIGPGTRRVLVESAWFDPVSIRRTARRYGLHTDASHRFERGTDPEGIPGALDRAAALAVEGGGGRVRRGVVDVYPRRHEPRRARLRGSRLALVLGLPLPIPEASGILRRLEFEVREEGGDALEAVAPSFRVDVEREIDLVEEVARHAGYDRVPAVAPPGPGAPPASHESGERRSRLRAALAASGLSETVQLPFTDPASHADWGGAGDALRLTNPLVEGQPCLRSSLLGGLVSAAGANFRRGAERVLLFEIGSAFRRVPGSAAVDEGERCAILLCGPSLPPHWSEPSSPAAFFDLKGIVETALRGAGCRDLRFRGAEAPFLHPAESAVVECGGVRLGVLGRLHPDRERPAAPPAPVLVAELDLAAAFSAAGPLRPKAEALSRHPRADRDLSLLVPSGVPFDAVQSAVREAAPPELLSIAVKDRWEGKGVPEGYVSITLSLRFQALSRTLTQEELARASGEVVRSLGERLGVRLRGGSPLEGTE